MLECQVARGFCVDTPRPCSGWLARQKQARCIVATLTHQASHRLLATIRVRCCPIVRKDLEVLFVNGNRAR